MLNLNERVAFNDLITSAVIYMSSGTLLNVFYASANRTFYVESVH